MLTIKKVLNLLYLFVFGLLISGCTAQGEVEKKNPEIPTLPVTQVITKDTVLHHDYVADIQAQRHVEIRARVKGFLDNIYVDEGQQVKKGQPLFRISSEEYEAELARTKANLNSAIAAAKGAQLEVDRVKTLVEKRVVTKSELEVAQAKLNAAKAGIEEAKSAQANAATKLSYTFIKAPFTGIIDRIPLKVGSLVDEGALLTTLSDLGSVYVYFNVSEKEYLHHIKAQQQGTSTSSEVVDLVLADGTRYAQKGKIETVEGVIEANTGAIAFRAKFPNPKQLLKHGSTGRVRLTNEVEEALLIPQKAAFEIQDQNFVYVVDQNNTLKIKNFKPRARLSHFYIVDSGLQPGDKVVYEGVQELRDGLTIKPVYIPMDSLLTAQNQSL
ncbi:efflux RND transporter periplasmic adaptor subunit [Adhaeribacter swui]|uniref:Efflux RND transporter periplasmic adaptor subunit n=1 Tax=Adhaeribacter swui TaxID=2086471 RepID=A0A7G7G9E9_9BACT|nr:efflux RND transporter periplasmic adaptor subunit [Adhaeribacter swui]QNF33783.1 efflux RND transporter periplasmic adaptor subunit [Adhaeribacter swui]